MPQLTFPASRAGLAVPVWVGLDGRTMTALRAAAKLIAPPVQARGLLDTGSNVTAVATRILKQLAIPVASTTSTQTAGGQLKVDLYEISLSVIDPAQPGSPWLTVADLLVMELAATLPDADVLIGLDVLLDCKLLLDGPARQFTLDF